MGTRYRAGYVAIVVILFMASAILFGIRGVSAAGNQPPGPDRFAVIQQKFTSYEWWLTRWSDNAVVCSISIDHQGLPTGGEILDACGQDIFDAWQATTPCTPGDSCSGYYLQFVRSTQAKRKVGVAQPAPVVWVSLNGCVPYKSTFRCESLPTLVLTGEEPLEGEHILNITGDVDGKPFTCDPVCQLDLTPTDENGITLDFWANSSYGDSSSVYQARVRVLASTDPNDQAWFADVISTQWRGDPLAGCSMIWDQFPTAGGLPDWLATPQRVEDLATSKPYEYLAAKLISFGIVDAGSCSDNGLQADGLASQCGLEVARPAVNDWQNRFDELIFNASLQTGVPAVLLKDIFARESQFWPGHGDDHPEAGLGQLTDGGADTLLTWNPSFYEQFCPSVLDESVCKSKIYPLPETGWEGIGLKDAERLMLRSALIQSVDAVCPDCTMGIDLEKADASVSVFAHSLVASCSQTVQVLDLNYGVPSNQAASYEDMWKFTLVDYNAGPGCLGLATDQTNNSNEPLDWTHLSSHLTPACQGALDYVNAISNPTP